MELFRYFSIGMVLVFILGMRGLPSLKRLGYITVPVSIVLIFVLFVW